MKKPVYGLVQVKGKWRCRHREMPRSFYEAETPEEALAGCIVAYKDFQAFIAHLEGRCDSDCRRCAEGCPKKGVLKEHL